jgi:hypothetical protein
LPVTAAKVATAECLPRDDFVGMPGSIESKNALFKVSGDFAALHNNETGPLIGYFQSRSRATADAPLNCGKSASVKALHKLACSRWTGFLSFFSMA